MFKSRQQGTVSISEYILVFILVVAVVAAMAVYIQRSLQGRLRDGRHYAMTKFREECVRTNCVGTGEVGEQYEPYYLQSKANIATDSLKHKGLMTSKLGSSGIFVARTSSNNQSNAQATQLPPMNAINDQVLGKK